MTELLRQVHFLRPEWFYGFIPLALFVLFAWRRKPGSRSWRQVCDARLLPYVLVQTATRNSRLPLLLGFFAAGLALFAMAGPVIEKLPQPVFRDESALVIALDLSQSMLASDIKPSRLERAKLKLTDILAARRGGQTALLAYAANAFTVTPLTDDANTIENLLPALEPGLMPAQGSEAGSAMELARTLLRQAGVQRGDVLLVTDGVRETDLDAIGQLRAAGHRVSVLGVGSPSGGPIPLSGGFLQNADGAIVIPKLDRALLQRAADTGGGIYAALQSTDRDVERLTALFGSDMPEPDSEQLELTADVWREEGPWLLLLVIPLAALWPRQGWIACIPLLILPVSEPARALDTNDLWSRPDQRAMRAFRDGDTRKAAELFEQPQWKASAWYRSGEFDKALESLPRPGSARDYYNRGNALAKLGRYPEALQAYDEALKLNPGDEDAAYNRELVQEQMQQSQQDNSSQQDPSDQDSRQQSGQESTGDQQQQQDSSNESPASEQAGDEPQPQPNEDTSESDIRTPDEEQAMTEQDTQSDRQENRGEESEVADRDNTEFEQAEQKARENAESEERIATEQWLRRIPDDPGGLMRRKFMYQYRQMPEYTQGQATNEPW